MKVHKLVLLQRALDGMRCPRSGSKKKTEAFNVATPDLVEIKHGQILERGDHGQRAAEEVGRGVNFLTKGFWINVDYTECGWGTPRG